MLPENAVIDIDSLKSILRDHLPIEDQAKILKDIEKTIEDDHSAQDGAPGEEAKEKLPKVPKKMVVLVTAPPLSPSDKDVSESAGFICEILEETSTREIPHMLREISETYKSSRKAKKNPAESIGDLWELAPNKLFKEYGLTKKSKSSVEFFLAAPR